MNGKINRLLSVSILTFVLLACNTLLPLPEADDTPTQIVEPVVTQSQDNLPLSEAGVPRVTVQDAKTAFDNGEAIIVDVRSQAAYDARHIAGALFIPLDMIETDIAGVDLPKDQWIITYCT
jgi:3-mercaptopyruvate sulfurtransferase SseA